MSRFSERFREEGMHLGEALVLERQLRLKFGALPDEVQQRSIKPASRPCCSGPSRAGPHRASRLDEVLH